MSGTMDVLVGKARDQITIDPDGDVWGDDILQTYVAEAHEQVQVDLNFGLPQNETGHHSFSTVAGTLEYNLPADFGQIGREGIVKYNGSVLSETGKKKLLQSSDLSSSGSPSRYYLHGLKIGFNLKPDSAKTVEMWYKALIAAPGAAGSDLPDDLDLCVAIYAKHLAFANQKNYRQFADDALEQYRLEIGRKRGKYLMRSAMRFGYQRS